MAKKVTLTTIDKHTLTVAIWLFMKQLEHADYEAKKTKSNEYFIALMSAMRIIEEFDLEEEFQEVDRVMEE